MKADNCPKCGKPLKLNATGRIGYCTLHKQWFAVAVGSESEAAAQNAADEKAAEETRLEKERQEQEKIRQEKELQHSANVRKAALVLIAVLAVAVCVVFFLVRPSVNYKNAEAKFAEKEYEEAFKAFSSLGSYKDSQVKAEFSSAMLALNNRETDTAVETLSGLVEEGRVTSESAMAEEVVRILTEWKEYNLSPNSALQLLAVLMEAELDSDRINVDELTVQVHSSMLDNGILEYEAYDVEGNGDKEMAVLNPDYTVSVYRMTSEGNVSANLDKETLSGVAVHFAKKAAENNLGQALNCYQTAYELFPSDENRSALVDCYKLVAAEDESAGKMDEAVENAEQALLLTREKEEFDYYYALNLKRCKANEDTAKAISEWDLFREENESSLKKHEDEEEWKQDAGKLHLDRAAELAAGRELSCAEELQIAANLGTDITETVNLAMSYFDEGLALTTLRIMAISIAESNADLQASLNRQMEEGIRTAVSEWKNNGIDSAEVPVLFKIADEQNVDLAGIDRQSIYEEAAVDASGKLVQYSFADWNEDGYEELIGIDKTGKLCLFGISDTWEQISGLETKLSNPEFVITDNDTPIVIVVSYEKDNLAVVTCKENQLKELFREESISRYNCTEEEVTFTRRLEGSIERHEEYLYNASGTESRPQRTGIDWQQDSYPLPETGRDAVQRYFETRIYNIPEEAELLSAYLSVDMFSMEDLSELAVPKAPKDVEIQSYYTDEDEELFEVSYKASGQDVRTWVKAIYNDGWKVAGCSDTYGADMDPSQPDYTIPLISLNTAETGVIESSDETRFYRMLVPVSGSGILTWRAGDKDGSKTAFVISLYKGTPYGEPVITYNLKPSGSRQQTNPIYLSPGVYYVFVEPKTDDAYEYSLSMKLEEAVNVELEENNTGGTATGIVADTKYAGSLLTASDVDYYSLEMEEPGGINVVLESGGNRTKAYVYTVELYDASSMSMLTAIGVPGNSPYSETGNVYISSGKYLIKVYKGIEWTDETYTLTVNLVQNGSMEAEINDTPDTANTVPINEEIHASIAKEGDVDCFAFALENDGVVQLSLGFTPTDSSSKTYFLTVMDLNRTVYQTISIGGKESTKVNAPLALPAGSYIVKVDNPAYIRQDYILKIACQDTDISEKEPNNSLGLATELQKGQSITGVLTTQEDTDYYRIKFGETQQVTLSFHFPQRNSTYTAYVLSIENNGQTLKKFDLKGDSGGMEAVIEFPAGEYYFKIKPSRWTGAIYTISIN